jgi:hypothetical protein
MAAPPLIVFDVNETLLDIKNDETNLPAHLWREESDALMVLCVLRD